MIYISVFSGTLGGLVHKSKIVNTPRYLMSNFHTFKIDATGKKRGREAFSVTLSTRNANILLKSRKRIFVHIVVLKQ